MTTVILPGDHKTVAVCRHRGITLSAAGPGINPELITDSCTCRVIALAEDAAAITRTGILPDDDEAAI